MKAPGEGAAVSGRAPFALATAPEFLGGELPPVLELLDAESNCQRHDDEVVLLDQIVGQVTGAVGHDPHTGHGSSLPR